MSLIIDHYKEILNKEKEDKDNINNVLVLSGGGTFFQVKDGEL